MVASASLMHLVQSERILSFHAYTLRMLASLKGNVREIRTVLQIFAEILECGQQYLPAQISLESLEF